MKRVPILLIWALIAGASSSCDAESELDALADVDCAVMQKLLAVDPKLTWNRSSTEHVVFILLTSKGATSEAISLLPRLPTLSALRLPALDPQLPNASKPTQWGPLMKCQALRDLRLEIGKQQTDADWHSLPILQQVTKVVITDHTSGQVQIYNRFPSVTSIILWSHGVERFDTSQIDQLDHLRSLSIHALRSSWNGEGLAGLNRCKRLEDLMVGGDGLADVALREIAQVTSLKKLVLISGKFTKEGFAALGSLESFSCTEPWFTDELASGLFNCGNLKKLNLSGSAVTGQCFNVLATLPLEEIHCSGLKTENFRLLKDCKTLRRIETAVRTRGEMELQQSISRKFLPNVDLVQTWAGDKGADPKSGK